MLHYYKYNEISVVNGYTVNAHVGISDLFNQCLIKLFTEGRGLFSDSVSDSTAIAFS